MQHMKHLPKQQNEKLELLANLQKQLKQLKQVHSKQNKSGTPELNHKTSILQLRIKLIQSLSSDSLSLDRIAHLQQIFKHYCTHIFKIGKHMTFERLQYEKVHITLDRFCIFLKDFGLLTAKFNINSEDNEPEYSSLNENENNEGKLKEYEIIEKNQIVKIFKKISKNCRDLSFEGFIAALQKLALLFYDNQQNFAQKHKQKHEDREKRIRQYKQKMKKRALQAKMDQQRPQPVNNDANPQNEFDEQPVDDKEENNELVENMMNDKNLEDPNEEVKQSINKDESQEKIQQSKEMNSSSKSIGDEYLLTVQQKIQNYYHIIGVDNVTDCRKRMRELGLPLFKQAKKSSSTKHHKNQITVTFQDDQKQENIRLIELREKLQLKKQKQKQQYSPMTKQEYEERKRRREEKQGDNKDSLKHSQVKKVTRKIDFSDKEINWDFVNHLEYNDLKIKLDFKKLLASDDDVDKGYLEEYGGDSRQYKSQLKNQVKSKRSNSQLRTPSDKTFSNMDGHRRNGSEIISSFKKRAKEVELHQFDKEAKLSRFMGNMRKQQRNYPNMSRF